MGWQAVAYAALLGGFLAVGEAGYFLHRFCERLSLRHGDTYDALGRPSIRRPARWPTSALTKFVRSREYAALDDPTLTEYGRRFQASVRVAALFAALAFVAVFAEAFTRAA